MKKFMYYLPSIIFNLFETVLIFVSAYLLKLHLYDTLFILLVFSICRFIFKPAKHYKAWQKCLIWSLIIFSGLFALYIANIIIAISYTIFSAFILSGCADIRDVFQWGGNDLNKRVYDWVRFNSNCEDLNTYEKELYKNDKQKYFIFIYRFKEFKSYSEISEIMNIYPPRITEEINIMSHHIEYGIRLKKIS